jgi:hypothetical protein
LFNLADFLPKKPGEVELKVMKEMFEASVDGQAYDADKWGQYFKPAGFNAPAGDSDAAPAAAAAPAKVAPAPQPEVHEDEDDAPVATAPVTAKPSSQKAEDILAMIRNRSK